MSYSLGIPNLTSAYVFKDLKRIDAEETKDKKIRMPSIANTYQNEPEFQITENLSRNFARSGQEKYADPFQFVSRPINWDYNGRNLSILKTLEANRKKDFPDVVTKTSLKVVGYY